MDFGFSINPRKNGKRARNTVLAKYSGLTQQSRRGTVYYRDRAPPRPVFHWRETPFWLSIPASLGSHAPGTVEHSSQPRDVYYKETRPRSPRVSPASNPALAYPGFRWASTQAKQRGPVLAQQPSGALYPQQPPGAPSAHGAGESAPAHPGPGPPRCQRMRAERMHRKKLAPFATENYFRVSFSFAEYLPRTQQRPCAVFAQVAGHA